MVSELFFYQLALIALLWLCCMLHWVWPSERVIPGATLPPPPLRPCKRSREPKPFAGLTRKPPCAACEQAHEHVPQPPGCPPPRLVPTRGRPRHVDTSRHFCPHPTCASRGWVGWGNLRANGLPTICQAECVTFFAPSTRPAYNEFGWHHSPYDHAAWPSGYAGVGRQYCVRPGHAAAPSPATPHTRC